MPSLIDAFTDFVASTGVKIVHGPDDILNDAVKNTYLIKRAVSGKDISRHVKAGQKLSDRIQLTDSGTATFYHPNDDLNIVASQNLKTVEVPWRFLADHYTYTEQEVELNSGSGQTYYKNLLKSKRQACMTSMYNRKEEALFARPSATQMEGDDGKLPYSLQCFISPQSSGLPYTGEDGTAWTVVETLNPSTNSRWRNQRETYDSGNKNDADVGLVAAFDEMWMKVKFESPRAPSEYFEDDRFQKMMICTSRDGRRIYLRLTRDANDRLMGADLGYHQTMLTYAGLPMEYIAELDTAAVRSDGTAMVAGSPWYYWVNFEYLYPIFHSQQYMKEQKPKSHPRQPFSYVVWKSTYYNWFCRSRRRQGLVYPAGG